MSGGKHNAYVELLEHAMQIGYARVSTPEQSLALQLDALRQAGCRKVYEEIISGARVERPVLQDLLTHLRDGDVLLIWKLDRLGRSLRHLIEVVTDLAQRGIGFKSLQENLDTTTSSGKLVFHMFGALAEFERDLIRERTQAGLVAARARGRLGGRPRGLSTPAKATALAAETLYREGQLSVRQIAAKLHIAKSTLYVYLRARGVPIGPYMKRGLDTVDVAVQVREARGVPDDRRPGHPARARRPRDVSPQPHARGTPRQRG
jgi:DNA invertase Pin-like site-specific DNA recombinase